MNRVKWLNRLSVLPAVICYCSYGGVAGRKFNFRLRSEIHTMKRKSRNEGIRTLWVQSSLFGGIRTFGAQGVNQHAYLQWGAAVMGLVPTTLIAHNPIKSRDPRVCRRQLRRVLR